MQWKNTSPTRHTVTADPEKTSQPDNLNLPEGAEPFYSGQIQPGATWSHTFQTPGRYRYFCVPHQGNGMVGEITVKPAGE